MNTVEVFGDLSLVDKSVPSVDKNLESTKQYLRKTLSALKGDYAVVKSPGDVVFLSDVDASRRSETEKMVSKFIDGSTFIVDNENNPNNIDYTIGEEISQRTKDRWNVVTTVFVGSERIDILR